MTVRSWLMRPTRASSAFCEREKKHSHDARHGPAARAKRGAQAPLSSSSTLGTAPNRSITTASSNSPVAGSPVREKATAPGERTLCHAARLTHRRGRRQPLLCLAGDELAIVVRDERERYEIGDRHLSHLLLTLAE